MAPIVDGTALPEALAALPKPTLFITVPRGLQNETPGLFGPAHLQTLLDCFPQVRHVALDDLNHYTVVMSPCVPGLGGDAGASGTGVKKPSELCVVDHLAVSRTRQVSGSHVCLVRGGWTEYVVRYYINEDVGGF